MRINSPSLANRHFNAYSVNRDLMQTPIKCDCCQGPLGVGPARVDGLVFCRNCIEVVSAPKPAPAPAPAPALETGP